MATYAKMVFTGSTNGKQIKVAAAGPTGTLIHTAVSGTIEFDEIWIYAVNSSLSPVKLTIEWGGTTPPDDIIEQTIAAEGGLVLIIPGWVLQNGLVARAYADTANVILVGGFVNRITP